MTKLSQFNLLLHSLRSIMQALTTCNVSEMFFTTDEDDLETVVNELNDIADVEGLGLALGIRMSALEKIALDNTKLDKQKTKVIYYWLTRKDIVRKRQGEYPTWDGIAKAVAKLNPLLSERIRHHHC